MTTIQFKNSLNSELRAAEFGRPNLIETVTEVNNITTLKFGILNMKLLKWLNDRFQHGISITETDHSIVFINTPLQSKTD